MKEIKSFSVALKGIIYSIVNERHMRVHLVFAIYVLFFSIFFDLSLEKLSILFLTIFIVIFGELINTVVEKIVDLFTEDYNPIVKIIKDISAGSVLVMALCSILVAICLFNDINGYIRIYNYFRSNYENFLLLLLSVIISFKFIEQGPHGFRYELMNIKNKIIRWLEKDGK